MKYDFTSIMDRHGKDAIAVDGLGTGFAPAAPKEGFDAIPMWVADMNFPTVPTIQEAIIERTNHPAFGYFNPTDEYFDSIIQWQAKRNGVQGLTKECIGYENGVLGGVISALNCVCSKGDKILIHSPTYIGFTMSLKNNGYEAVHSPLVKDENGVWRMDFEDMEKHLKEEKIHAAIMCNPHNPCEVLTGNIDFACDYIEKHFEGVTVSKPQGTYMLFVDCTDWCKAHGKTIEDVEHACWDVGAAIQDGTMFFGPCHLRMNLASPRSRIEEAFHRMDKYVFNA